MGLIRRIRDLTLKRLVRAVRGPLLSEAWADYMKVVGRFKSAGNTPPGERRRSKKPKGTQYVDALSFGRFTSVVGDIPVKDVRLQHVEEYRAHLRSQKNRRGDPLKSQTVLRQETPIRAFLRWCVKRDYLNASPYEKMDELPLDEEAPREALTVEEAQALIQAAPAWLSHVLFFLASTGVRRAQVCFLTWGSIDFEARAVTFRATRHFKTKSRRSSKLPMSEPMREFLEELYHTALAENRGGPEDFVFKGPDGEFLRPDRLTKEVGELMRNTLSRSVGSACHAFRWFAATAWSEGGGHSKTTAAMLGLTTDRMLQRRYHQVRNEKVVELVERTALPRTIVKR
jgi:integrase